MKLNEKGRALLEVFAIALGLVVVTQALRIILTKADYALIYNEGIAFGLLADSAMFALVLNILALSAIIYLVVDMLAKKTSWIQRVAFSLLLAGGFSNLYERLTLGHVVDYLEIKGVTVFNVADIAVDVAITILVIVALYEWYGKYKHNHSDD